MDKIDLEPADEASQQPDCLGRRQGKLEPADPRVRWFCPERLEARHNVDRDAAFCQRIGQRTAGWHPGVNLITVLSQRSKESFHTSACARKIGSTAQRKDLHRESRQSLNLLHRATNGTFFILVGRAGMAHSWNHPGSFFLRRDSRRVIAAPIGSKAPPGLPATPGQSLCSIFRDRALFFLLASLAEQERARTESAYGSFAKGVPHSLSRNAPGRAITLRCYEPPHWFCRYATIPPLLRPAVPVTLITGPQHCFASFASLFLLVSETHLGESVPPHTANDSEPAF